MVLQLGICFMCVILIVTLNEKHPPPPIPYVYTLNSPKTKKKTKI